MPSCWYRCKCMYLFFFINSSLKYKTNALIKALLVTISLLKPTASIIHISRCMHVHSQSVTSEQIRESCGPTVCRCLSDFLYHSFICSPPLSTVCLSICLSASCSCIALSKSLYRHKDASTCNFSAMNSPMKHSSESSYYSFPSPIIRVKSPPPSAPVNPSTANICLRWWTQGH